jgi:hypothetical protein
MDMKKIDCLTLDKLPQGLCVFWAIASCALIFLNGMTYLQLVGAELALAGVVAWIARHNVKIPDYVLEAVVQSPWCDEALAEIGRILSTTSDLKWRHFYAIVGIQEKFEKAKGVQGRRDLIAMLKSKASARPSL